MTTPTSRSVSMIFRNYNTTPLIDVRPRCNEVQEATDGVAVDREQ